MALYTQYSQYFEWPLLSAAQYCESQLRADPLNCIHRLLSGSLAQTFKVYDCSS